ncbi:MAG: single-stranded DNA-binding protein [Acidobacteriota bacterium]|nr:single-stranded DNA-binding protein [Acidobacteriota bacterium]
MASFNKIVIVGYLGRDPEIRYLPDGTAVCNFSVATTEKKKDRSGESQDITTWFRINVWGRQAEAANQYLSKGRQVYVEGRLSQQEYTDKDGNRRTTLDIRATDVQFLGPRGDESSFSGSSSQPSQRSAPPDSSSGISDDGEIPF